MLRRRGFQSKAAASVVGGQGAFFQAIQRALSQPKHDGPQKLGLALSGGVDSMALATLCRNVKKALHPNAPFTFHPFIVDHKARNGSMGEANLVSDRLERLLDVKPTILTLQWPEDANLSNMTNFESMARRLRYRALGRACYERGIQSLFVGHHEDDVVETVLLRLVDGHTRIGIQGIRPSGDIPECHGIYGVNRSGGKGSSPQAPESGGVLLIRPLLYFPKERLVEICRSAGIEWVEDPTNRDPTLTPRNAIRSLLSSGRLPRALQKQSMLRFLRSSQQETNSHAEAADRLYNACDFHSFDLRSGELDVTIPPLEAASKTNDIAGWSLLKKQHVVAIFLQRLMLNVTPQDKVSLYKLRVTAETIFPEIRVIAHPNTSPVQPGFTCSYIMFRLADQAESMKRWRLSRQPFSVTETNLELIIPPLKKTWLAKRSDPSGPTTSFHLWDGRFWLRVENATSHFVCVRPLRESDVKPLQQAFKGKSKLSWQALKTALKGHLRWTSPVIAFADNTDLLASQCRVLGLPSFGIVLPEWERLLTWDIRYKKIDLGPHQDKIVGVMPKK